MNSTGTRIVLTPMRGHWNVNGTNQTFSTSQDTRRRRLRARVPYYNPGETTVIDLLSRERPMPASSRRGSRAHCRGCNEQPRNHSTIVIDPFVSLSTAFADVHTGRVGSTARNRLPDGLHPDPAAQGFDLGLPTDEEVLLKILRHIREARSRAWQIIRRCSPDECREYSRLRNMPGSGATETTSRHPGPLSKSKWINNRLKLSSCTSLVLWCPSQGDRTTRIATDWND